MNNAPAIACLVCHGIGQVSTGYSHPLRDAVISRVTARGLPATALHWQEVLWSDILDPRQQRYLDTATARHRLGWTCLRAPIMSSMSDALAYQRVADHASGAYVAIHTRVAAALKAVRAATGPETPVVLIGHSLGAVVWSNYVWDLQHDGAVEPARAAATCPLTRLETLAGMVSFGTTLPLFALAYQDPQPITFPGPCLPEELASASRWLNLFARSDVLGWPLAEICPAYAALPLEDRAVTIGNWWRRHTPLSHTAYWRAPAVADASAECLCALLRCRHDTTGAPR